MSIRAAIAVGLLTLALPACGSTSTPQATSFSNPFGSPVSAAAATPQSISRAELMSKYAQINPLDRSATPETMDALADSACRKLREGYATDKLITVSTDIYKTNATQMMMLLVSYRCPEFLKDFK